MGSETKPKTSEDGWVYYRPDHDGDAPADYQDGDEWEFNKNSTWRQPIGNYKPNWTPGFRYRYRPRPRPLTNLPDGNPKTAAGSLKTPLLSVIPSPPLIQVGEVMRLGREKYGPFNWRDQPVTASTYVDAAMRHLTSWWDGETTDPESGESHLAHAVSSLLVIMDAIATGNAADDRPKKGVTGELIAAKRAQREPA